VTEVRDKTGSVVARAVSFAETGDAGTACGDSRHKLIGPSWRTFEAYVVDVGAIPAPLRPSEALADLVASHRAWESPFVTDCTGTPGRSRYEAIYGGTTKREASLVRSLTPDGANVVAFQSLAGTICDGAVACVVLDYKGSTVNEADLALELDLARYGYDDSWTTDDTTWFDALGGQFAVSDVATHEWSHFAGSRPRRKLAGADDVPGCPRRRRHTRLRRHERAARALLRGSDPARAPTRCRRVDFGLVAPVEVSRTTPERVLGIGGLDLALVRGPHERRRLKLGLSTREGVLEPRLLLRLEERMILERVVDVVPVERHFPVEPRVASLELEMLFDHSGESGLHLHLRARGRERRRRL
jgi:hypothetical protein